MGARSSKGGGTGEQAGAVFAEPSVCGLRWLDGEGGKMDPVNHVGCGTGERREQKLRAWHTTGRLDWEWLIFQHLNFSKASLLRSSTLSLAVRCQK